MVSRKKHLAIRRSKRPWRNGESEHILNRFPSSARDVFMWRAEPARSDMLCTYVQLYMYTSTRCFWRGLTAFFGGVESFEFKRFKAISQGVARRIVGARTPIDRRRLFSLSCYTRSCRPPRAPDPFSFFLALLSPFTTVVTYCELLREPCRIAGRSSACPFRRGKFRAT